MTINCNATVFRQKLTLLSTEPAGESDKLPVDDFEEAAQLIKEGLTFIEKKVFVTHVFFSVKKLSLRYYVFGHAA